MIKILIIGPSYFKTNKNFMKNHIYRVLGLPSHFSTYFCTKEVLTLFTDKFLSRRKSFPIEKIDLFILAYTKGHLKKVI